MITANASGVLKTLGEISANDGGVLKKLSTVHTNDGGVLRQIFSAGTPISTLNVGDTFKIKENGAAQTFIVVHKGRPSSMYDSSCDGIWVLRYTGTGQMTFDVDGSNAYAPSSVYSWLNNTYYSRFDANTRKLIKQVKIPYEPEPGPSSTGVQTGANGLSCKIFLLGASEVGFESSSGYVQFASDGSRLSYFLYGNADASAAQKRIDSLSDLGWWLRTPLLKNNRSVAAVTGSSYISTGAGKPANVPLTSTSQSYYRPRPAFILDYSARLDKNGFVVA